MLCLKPQLQVFIAPLNLLDVLSSFKATTFIQIQNNSFMGDVMSLQALHQVLEQVLLMGVMLLFILKLQLVDLAER